MACKKQELTAPQHLKKKKCSLKTTVDVGFLSPMCIGGTDTVYEVITTCFIVYSLSYQLRKNNFHQL